MDLGLSGRVFIVTGGSAGLGRANADTDAASNTAEHAVSQTTAIPGPRSQELQAERERYRVDRAEE